MMFMKRVKIKNQVKETGNNNEVKGKYYSK